MPPRSASSITGRSEHCGNVMSLTGRLSPALRDVLRIEEEIRHQEFAPDARRVEVAVRPDPDRPDLIALLVVRQAVPGRRLAEIRAAGDRIVQPDFAVGRDAPDAEPPHPPPVRRDVPALRRQLELSRRTVRDPRLRIGIEGNRRQAALLLGVRVQEVGAALHAVIVEAEIRAVAGADAMDHAGLHVRHEQLLVPAVVRDVAQGGAGVRPAVERDVGERPRHVARARDRACRSCRARRWRPTCPASTARCPASGAGRRPRSRTGRCSARSRCRARRRTPARPGSRSPGCAAAR